MSKSKREMTQEERKQKRRALRWKIPVIVLAVLLLIPLLARAYFRIPVLSYYADSEKGFRIPGLGDGFVPQGLEYDARSDLFLITGYQKDGSASPIYAIDRASKNEIKRVSLLLEDGSAFCGHAGGLSVYGNYVYIAGGDDCCLYVYSYTELMAAQSGASLTCLGRFETGDREEGIRVSFVSTDGHYLYVGEFYREGSYDTPTAHHWMTKAGEGHRALAVAYAFSEENDASFGLEKTPRFAYTLPNQVQGMCVREGRIDLSTSYGMAFSHLLTYDTTKLQRQDDLRLGEWTLPRYALDSASRIADRKIPPMSEEIVFVNGRLYTMCESASNKYWFGKLTSAKWCYATDMSEDVPQ